MSQNQQEPEVIRQDVTSTAITLAPPTDGKLARGGTLQFDMRDAVAVATTSMRGLIDKNIKKQTALLKAAQAALKKAEDDYAAEAAKVATPPAFVSDLEAVRLAILAFHPAAVLDVATWDKRPYAKVDRALRSIEIEGSVRAGGGQVFEAERKYPFAEYDRTAGTNLIGKAAAIDVAQELVTGLQNKLAALARDRHNAKDRADDAAAALVRHQMTLTPEGQAALAAMEAKMNEHARMAGLETDLD